MSVRIDDAVIFLEGDCPVEDAEHLLTLLQESPQRRVDLTHAGHLHTATVQVLLAMRPPIAGQFADGFQSRWIAPLLEQHSFEWKHPNGFPAPDSMASGARDAPARTHRAPSRATDG
jgi:hypothetical protein